MRQLKSLLLVSAGVLCAASVTHAAPPAPMDLGVLPGGTWSFAVSMNDRGQIAGQGDGPGHVDRYLPVLWHHGHIRELPLLPGDANSNVHSINNRGDVIGWTGSAAIVCPANTMLFFITATCDLSLTTGLPQFAVIWHHGTVKEFLPRPSSSNTLLAANAFGINDDGDITFVSVHFTAACNTFACLNPTRRATVLADGVVTELPYLPTALYSVPHAIISNGAVVGYSGINALASGPKHAALWAGDNVSDLGVFLGGTNSEAWSMNSQGQIVGYSTGKTAAGVVYTHAALWDHGALMDLGTLPGGTASTAFGINNRRQVVGYSNTVAGGNVHAVLWQCGQIIDLGTLPGGDAARANAINEGGQISGGSNGTNADGIKFMEHAVLWNLRDDDQECDEGHDD